MTHPDSADPQPRTTTLSLVLLLLEGWAYLVGICLLFVLEFALIGWGFLTRNPFIAVPGLFVGVPLLLLTGSAIRALFFRLPEYQGIEISAAEAPALHRMLAEVRAQVRAPRVQRVLAGKEFNAAAIHERVGVRSRNTLLLGWPLFTALSPDQMRAVIAHELAHFARADSRVAHWVYRTRLSWSRLLGALEARRATPIFVYWIAHNYGPRLFMGSAGLSRAHEQLADQLAARVAGSRTAAEALVILDAGAFYLGDVFWPRLLERVSVDAEPPLPFTEMSAELRGTGLCLPPLEQQSNENDDDFRTHPSLRERLERLQQPMVVPTAPVTSAGEALLGPCMPELAARLDEHWRAANGAKWRARHGENAADRRRLKELAAVDVLSAAEQFERAQLIERIDGTLAALPIYQRAWQVGHAAAGIAAGGILLSNDDPTGIEIVEAAMEQDSSSTVVGCEAMVAYYERRGDRLKAESYYRRLTRHATRAGMAEQERKVVTAVDAFVSHDASPAQLADIVTRLTLDATVLEAFLVSRQLRYSDGRELVLCIATSTPADPSTIAVAGRGAPRVVTFGRTEPLLRKVIETVPGSRIYTRNGRLL
jgi:Zn-dependent protease with chaperone function